jgi:hypothetical protein
MNRKLRIRHFGQGSRRLSVKLTCKHLANPARTHRSAVSQLDALVIPSGDELPDRDLERASHQEYLIESGPAQACLKLADCALSPGAEPSALESPGCLLLRQALVPARLGNAPADQLIHPHLPSICEQSR